MPITPYKLTPEFVRLLTEIDEFKGAWTALQSQAQSRLAELKTVSVVQSVGSSTRIEGSKLSDDEVAQLLGGIGKKSFKSRDEEEVAGYADTLQEVYRSWEQIPLTENHIKQLHGMVLRHSSKDQRHLGEYKKAPNNVVATDPQGKVVGIVFETATPFATPGLMTALVEDTRRELEAREHHPLLVIGDFVVRFLAIHPFQDGNGRLSRILTNLLLLRQGYAYVPYSSMEHLVEGNKAAYYLALRTTQKALGTPKPNPEPWLLFFLRSLKAQKDYLKKLVEEAGQLMDLDSLDAAILQAVQQHGKVGLTELATLTTAKKATLKVRLAKLVQAGRLERGGKGPATFYRRTAGPAQ